MKIFQNIKHIFFIIALCLTILFSTYMLFLTNFMSPINHFFIYRTGTDESRFQDMIYKPNLEASRNIVVVEVDEKSINLLSTKSEYGMLNIRKDIYIKLLNILKESNVRAVGFDIVFQNPDIYEKAFADKLVEFGNAVIAVIEPLNHNKRLHNATLDNCNDLAGSGNLLDIICPFTPRSVYGKVKWGVISGDNKRSQTIEKRTAGYRLKDYSMQYWMKYATGNITDPSPVYNLGFSLALFDGNENAQKIAQKWDISTKNANQMPQPLLPYFSRTNLSKTPNFKPYPSISLVDLIHDYDERNEKYKKNPSEPKEESPFTKQLQNAYIFVGESGDVLHDTFISPVTNESLAGVYSHAMMLDGVLQNKMLEKLNDTIAYISAIFLTIIAVVLYFFLPKFLAPIIAIISIVATIFVARYSYAEWRIVIDILPFLLGAGIVTYPITYIYKFFIVEKDKRHIVQAFSRYLSPSVVEMIDANKVAVSLGGEKKELSIFFSDIAGFTSIAEKMDTKDLFIVMTKYLSDMTEILVSEKGTLDKYIGDAVMGFFGAPVDDPLHAINACNTAIRMRSALKKFNEWLANSGHESIDFRVGIATGEVMVGNIGSEKQFNYTVLGDTVNLASRLEGAGKEYGVNIIISADTKMATGDLFLTRELDYIAVKGKSTGVRIYELLGKHGDDIEMVKYTSYESALRLYREGKFLEAGQIFEKYMENDPPSKMMAYRCISLLKGEMQLENGVYHMMHK